MFISFYKFVILLFFIVAIADAQTLDKKQNTTKSVLLEENAREIVSRNFKIFPDN